MYVCIATGGAVAPATRDTMTLFAATCNISGERGQCLRAARVALLQGRTAYCVERAGYDRIVQTGSVGQDLARADAVGKIGAEANEGVRTRALRLLPRRRVGGVGCCGGESIVEVG